MSDIQPTVAPSTSDLYQSLAPIAGLGDGDDNLGWPLLRFLDGLGQIIQRYADLASDTAAGEPGWSLLVDPGRCPTYGLGWLAQMVGVRFDQTQSTDTTQRAAITAEQGFMRGTPAALQAAAAKWLQPNQQVVVYERDTDPYHFTVALQLGSLAAATFAQTEAEYPTFAERTAARSTFSTPAYPEAQVQAALAAQKPAGLIMTVNIIAGPSFGQVQDAFATFAERQAALPTFADVSIYMP